MYRLLLRAYPAWFRERYAEEMLEFFRAAAAEPRSPAVRARFWAHLLADLVVSTTQLRRGRSATADSVRAHEGSRAVEPLQALLRDLHYATRVLARRRAFAAAAVVTLALGIGATTVIYSIVSAVLLRPLPCPDADRLVAVWTSSAGDPHGTVCSSSASRRSIRSPSVPCRSC